MSPVRWLFVLALLAGVEPPAGACGPGQGTYPCVPDGCPDDYCPKQLPVILCPRLGASPGDYHPKCLPPVPYRAPRGCVDDYVPKQLPCVLPPRSGPWWTCGPPDACVCPRCGKWPWLRH
ncbi:MAG TPA: hypothetical protein VKD72_34005 [Gemmataceae bacterium]|nr:hypothetical protein [Gemmataceae bacterium]